MLAILKKNKTYFISLFVFWIATAFYLLIFNKNESFLNLIPKERNLWIDNFFSYITLAGDGWSFVLLLIILLFISYRYFVAGTIIFGISSLCTYILKQIFDAPRPVKYFMQQQIELSLPAHTTIHADFSFPSGHTTTAFAMFTLLACLINHPIISYLLFAFGILAAYSRIYLCQHFPEDILAGSVLGFIITVVVLYFILKIPTDKLRGKLSLTTN
jgi:membrane-associated phospholipid phosphatase